MLRQWSAHPIPHDEEATMDSISSAKNKVSFYMRPEDEARVRAAFRLVHPGGRQGSLSHLYSHAVLSYVAQLEARYNGGQPFPEAQSPDAAGIRTQEITSMDEWPGLELEAAPVSSRVRFIPLEQVEEILSISRSQSYALVRSGDLRAIQVGGRGQWRVELSELDAYIARAYRAAEAAIAEKPPTN